MFEWVMIWVCSVASGCVGGELGGWYELGLVVWVVSWMGGMGWGWICWW